MKMALIKTYRWFQSRPEMNAHILTWVHDEFQMECKPEYAEEVRKKVIGFIEEVGKELNLKCFLTGEGRVGNNWQETH